MIGRAAKLERLGLAEQVAPGCWTLKPGIEGTLRDLSVRGDIIKTMHRAVTGAGREPDLTGFTLHGDQVTDPVQGRLVARGLHDELRGTAYAVIDGVDGRTHHLIFSDLEVTGDAKPGAVVEMRAYEDGQGRRRSMRSDQHVRCAPGCFLIHRCSPLFQLSAPDIGSVPAFAAFLGGLLPK
jgi:type IV secretory pathway VirD2 relaxase